VATPHPGISWTVLASGAGLAFVIAGAGWTLFQDNIVQIRVELRRINDQLDARRHEFVTQEEFKQFIERVKERDSAIDKRISEKAR
jgi:hypothetical protein